MSLSKKRNHQRGAVLAEFTVAIIPLLAAFFGFLQVGKLYTANLVHKHAARTAARVAAVTFKPGGRNNPGASGKTEEITSAAKLAFGPYIAVYRNIKVETKISNTSDTHGMVTVCVTATYDCSVPLGASLVCGATPTVKVKTECAQLNLEGASYEEES
jgi:Flp pilus assembly protein TadG